MRARPTDSLADWCELQIADCYGRAAHRHHRLPRSAGGSDERENTLDVCSRCHEFIHANPTLSYEQGWSLRRTV